jgi:hypothetical protein
MSVRRFAFGRKPAAIFLAVAISVSLSPLAYAIEPLAAQLAATSSAPDTSFTAEATDAPATDTFADTSSAPADAASQSASLTPFEENALLEDSAPFEDSALPDPSFTPSASLSSALVQDSPLPEGSYYIRPACSLTRMLDIYHSSTSSGANLQLHHSNKTSAQVFTLKVDEQGYYTIHTSFNMVLDVAGALSGANVFQNSPVTKSADDTDSATDSANNPTKSALSTPADNTGQKWILQDFGEEGYEVVSALSFSDTLLCLDLYHSIDADGTNLQLYRKNDSHAQRFFFLPVDYTHPGSQSIQEGVYTLHPLVNTALALDMPAAQDTSGLRVQTYLSNATVAQMFQIRFVSGAYKIVPMSSGKPLSVSAEAIVAKSAVVQQDATDRPSQAWQIEVTGYDGSFPVAVFRALESGLALDVPQSSLVARTPLWLYRPNNTNAQRFVLRAVQTTLAEGIYGFVPRYAQDKRIDIPQSSHDTGLIPQIYRANQTGAQAFELLYATNPNDPQNTHTYAIRTAHSGKYLTEGPSGVISQQPAFAKEAPSTQQLWTIELFVGGHIITNVATGNLLCGAGSAVTSSATQDLTSQGGFAPEHYFHIRPASIIQTGAYELYTPENNRLDVPNNSNQAKTATQLCYANGSEAQKFILKDAGEGLLSIKKVYSDMVLDVARSAAHSGATIWIYPSNNTDAQRFLLVPSGDGWYLLKAQCGPYLAAATDATGAALVTTTDKSSAQRFRLQETEVWPQGFTAAHEGTYAEVNLTLQKMLFVHNGEIVIYSDIVSGAPVSLTPTGIFQILYVQTDTRLIGPTWNVAVNYWFPITWDGYGLHDATWQPAFGGDLWRTNGSHGCVNMPLDVATTFYQYAAAGTTVLIHY